MILEKTFQLSKSFLHQFLKGKITRYNSFRRKKPIFKLNLNRSNLILKTLKKVFCTNKMTAFASNIPFNQIYKEIPIKKPIQEKIFSR